MSYVTHYAVPVAIGCKPMETWCTARLLHPAGKVRGTRVVEEVTCKRCMELLANHVERELQRRKAQADEEVRNRLLAKAIWPRAYTT